MDTKNEWKERPPTDPVTGQSTSQAPEERETGVWRSNWPLLAIVLAGLALALTAWLPAELRRDVDDVQTSSTTTQPTTDVPKTPIPPGTAPQPPTPPAQ